MDSKAKITSNKNIQKGSFLISIDKTEKRHRLQSSRLIIAGGPFL